MGDGWEGGRLEGWKVGRSEGGKVGRSEGAKVVLLQISHKQATDCEFVVTSENGGGRGLEANFPRQGLLHRSFSTTDAR